MLPTQGKEVYQPPGDNFVQLDFGGRAVIYIKMEDPAAACAREGMPAANDAPALDEDEQEGEPVKSLRRLVISCYRCRRQC